MRAYELLEYNQDSLLKTFNDKFLDKWKREGKPFADDIGSEGENILQWLEQYDPTQNKKYMTWLMGKYAGKKAGIKRLEDIPSRAYDLLNTYDRLARKKKLEPEHKNINQIKSLSDLWDILQTYKEEDTSSQQEKASEIEQAMYDDNDAELIHDDKQYKVVIPKTHKASCYFGKNTQWCTVSAGSSSYHDQHSEQGPLYIILEKSTNTRWQFHFESGQFMDENDTQIDLQEFFGEHQTIFDLFEELDITYMKIYKLQEIVDKKGFSDEVADILDSALRQNNIRTEGITLYKEPKDKNIEIIIDEWSNFDRFIEEIDDTVILKLYNIYDDGLDTDDYNIKIEDEDYIDLIKMLDKYHQNKLFAVSGTTNPQKTLWILQRENHEYFQQLDKALEESYRTTEELKEQIKERILKYINEGFYFQSYHTYTNLNDIKNITELDFDKPVYLLISLDNLIGHAQTGAFDENGEYDNYKIQEHGWSSLDHDSEFQEERRREEELIDEKGDDIFLQTIIVEPNLDIAYDKFRYLFQENEELNDRLMLEKMIHLSNIK